jgi:hypothetical protein
VGCLAENYCCFWLSFLNGRMLNRLQQYISAISSYHTSCKSQPLNMKSTSEVFSGDHPYKYGISIQCFRNCHHLCYWVDMMSMTTSHDYTHSVCPQHSDTTSIFTYCITQENVLPTVSIEAFNRIFSYKYRKFSKQEIYH